METVLRKIDGQEQAMLSFLESIVNIDSGADNPDGIGQVAAIIGARLERTGFSVQYLDNPGVCTHVLAHKPGAGLKQVMLIGHMDTVFLCGTTVARPFTIHDGRAYGPGVLDMKAGITIAVFALEALLQGEWQEKSITVLFCGDEEKGHRKTNAVQLIEREAGGKDAVFNLEPGTDDGGVTIGRKGIAAPEITVKGRSAHAGRDPQKGASAVVELAHKILAISSLTNYESGVTYNVGIMNGGTVSNAVPGQAYAKVDIRFTTAEQAQTALADLKAEADKVYVPGTTTTVCNDQVTMLPMETTETGLELLRLVQEQGRKLGLPELSGNYLGGGSDSCWTVRAGAPTVCSMGACGGFAHSEEEYILVDSLTERAKLLALCINAV